MLRTIERRVVLSLVTMLGVGLSGIVPAAAQTPEPAPGAGDVPAPEAPAVEAAEPEAPAVEVTAAALEKGGELVARAVAALGGAERLDAVKSVETATVVEVTGPQGEMEVRRETILVFPGRLRQETEMGMGTMAQVLDGDTGFTVMGPRARPLPESRLAAARDRLRRDLVSLLRRRGDEGFVAVHAGAGEVDGAAVETVEVRFDGDTVRLGIDPESGRVRSMAYHGSVMRREGEVEKVLSDYRKVGGLVLPFASTLTLDGGQTLELRVESIVVDGKIDPALFEMPAESASPRDGPMMRRRQGATEGEAPEPRDPGGEAGTAEGGGSE